MVTKQSVLGPIPSDWFEGKFEDVFTGFSSGMTPFRGTPEYYKGTIPWITSGELNYNIIIDTIEKITSEAVLKTNLKLLPKGTFLMAITGLEAAGTRGSCAITGIEATTNQSCMALYPIAGKSLTEYLYHFYVKYGNKFAFEYCQGTKQQSYTGRIVRILPIILPPTLTEQKAIATALSDVDELIANLEKLIEKKKAIKQGAMQQLLTPRKNWSKKRIEEIADVGRGRVISHKEIDSSIDNSYPVYSSQTSNDGIMGYIGTFDFEGEYVTWTTDGVNAGTVFYRNGRFNCTNVCGTLKLKRDNAKFIAILLNGITPKYVSTNLANPKLMNDVMKKIEIFLPCDIQEQNQIAETLSLFELEILKLEKRYKKMLLLKTGMMQELLTGRTRLI